MRIVLYLMIVIGTFSWALAGCGVDPFNPGGDEGEGGADLSALDIHDGIGVGVIELGKSGMGDIRKIYGEPDFENGRGVHFFNSYGLRFMLESSEGIFYGAEFTSPYKGRTLLGVANGDLRTKVITSYGSADDFTADPIQMDFVTAHLGLGGLKPSNLLFYDQAGILFVITDNEIVSSIFIFNRFLIRPSSSSPVGSPSPTPSLSPGPEQSPSPSPTPTSSLGFLVIDDGVGVGEIRVDGTSLSTKVEDVYGSAEDTKIDSGLKELSYNGMGVFFYADQDDVVRSISFTSPYQGDTKLGVKLGNHYKLVWGLYGYPEEISEGNDHYYCKGISFSYDALYYITVILIYEPSCAPSEN